MGLMQAIRCKFGNHEWGRTLAPSGKHVTSASTAAP